MKFPHFPRLWLLAALLAALGMALLAPFMNPYHVAVIETAGVSIILAVSLNLVLGHTGQFSLGHAGFMGVGAFAAAAATNLLAARAGLQSGLESLHLAPWLAKQVLVAPALLAGGLVAALLGLLVGIPSLRLKGDYLAIVTLGFGEILAGELQYGQNTINKSEALREQLPWVGASSVEVPERAMLFWTLALVAITLYVCQSLVKSSFGLGLLAVRDNEVAAESCGISATRAKITAFTIGAFFAGLAGGLFAHFNGAVSPGGFRFDRSMEVVLIVILGGLGRNHAVVAAAIGVTLLSEGLRQTPKLFPTASGPLLEILQNRAFLFALLLVILMIVRPQGLFSGWRKPKLLGGSK